jgi:hypothetical protein
VASLKQVIDKNRQQRDASGTLVDTSRQAGLASPPITPGGADALGVSPDVSKMAGTPAQKKSALEQASQGLTQPTLQETLRLRDNTKETSGKKLLEGLVSSQKATQLEGLGAATDRVSQLINAEINKTGQATQPATVGLKPKEQVQQTLDIDPSKIDAAYAALSAVFAPGISEEVRQKAVVDFNNAAGRINSTFIGYEALQQTLQEDAKVTAQAGAAAIVDADAITVGKLLSEKMLPYTLEDLSELLNLAPADVEKLTPEGLLSQIEAVKDLEFSQGQNLASNVAPLGAAERQLAFQERAKMGSTGVASAEMEVGRLVQDVENLGTVMFNGQEYDFRTLLADDKLSQVITDYARMLGNDVVPNESDTGWQSFKKSEPGLADFILNYRKGLFAVSDEVKGASTAVKTNLDARKAIGKIGPNLNLDDKVVEAFYGADELNKVTGETLQDVGIIRAIKSLPAQVQGVAVANLNKLAENPELAAQLKGLTPEQAAQLGLDRDMLTADTAIGRWYRANKFQSELKRARRSDGSFDVDLALQTVFGDASRDSMSQALAQSATADIFGDPLLSEDVLNLLDRNRDGALDSDADLTKQLTQTYPATTSGLNILDVLKGTTPASALKVNFNKSATINPEQQGFLGAVGDPNKFRAAIADGKLDDTERAELGFTDEEIIQFANTLKDIGLGEVVDLAIGRTTQRNREKITSTINSTIEKLGLKMLSNNTFDMSISDRPESQLVTLQAQLKEIEGLVVSGNTSPELENLRLNLNDIRSRLEKEITTRQERAEVTRSGSREFVKLKDDVYGKLGVSNSAEFKSRIKSLSKGNLARTGLDTGTLIRELEKQKAAGVNSPELEELLMDVEEAHSSWIYRMITDSKINGIGSLAFKNAEGNWDFGNRNLDPRLLEIYRDDLESVGEKVLNRFPELRKVQKDLTYWINKKRGRR